MRIKRFLAPDMRTALRMVRDEQGPDAVILSNRATADGIEIVAATDYDEALMSQALRAAAPGLEPLSAPATRATATVSRPVATPAPRLEVAGPVAAPVTEPAPVAAPVVAAPVAPTAAPGRTPVVAVAEAAPAAPVAHAPAQRDPARESLISRARAIFRIGDGAGADGPTLAELTSARPARATAMPSAPRRLDIIVDDALDEDMQALAMPAIAGPVAVEARVAVEAVAFDAPVAAEAPLAPAQPESVQPEVTFESLISAALQPAAAPAPAVEVAAPVASTEPPPSTSPFAQASDADYLIALSTPGALAAPAATRDDGTTPARALHAVAAPRTELPDPSIVAMREELASMRALMEKQMEQLSLERLRGSPARAAALDALLGYGCDDALAQAVAGALDPRLAGDALQAALATQFAQAIPALRAEPIEDGGVIALVGPTGAGKTTVAAKLAARFAARHRARDVALVSVDRERTGAREQLHAYGRRLGVTVCDAESADELGQALDQLVDYPLVLVDTTGYGVRDRALLRQILWLRSSSRLRSLLVLPANANPHDLAETARRYRPAAPLGVVLTKLDETGRAGAALSVLADQGLPLAYTSAGQQIPQDLQAADPAALAPGLAPRLEKTTRAAVNPLATEDRHAFA